MMELEKHFAEPAGIDFVSSSNSDRQLDSLTKRVNALAERGESAKYHGAYAIGISILALLISGIGIFLYTHDVRGSLRIINLPGYVVRDSGIEYSQDYAGVAGKYLASIESQLNACKAESKKAAVAKQADTAEAAAAAAAGSPPENHQEPGPAATESCTALQNGFVYMRAQAVMLEAPNAARDHGATFISDVAWLNEHQGDADLGFMPEANTMEQLSKRAAWLTANGSGAQPRTAWQIWKGVISNVIVPGLLLGGILSAYGRLLGKRAKRLQRQMKKLAKA